MTDHWELNDKVLWRDRPVTIRDRPTGAITIVQEDDGGTLLQVPTSELAPRVKRSDAALTTSLMQIDQKAWDQSAARAEVLRSIVAAEDRTLLVRARAIELGISERQLWRLVKQFERGGESVSALLPKARGRRKGCRVLSPEVEKLITDALEEHYLRRERPSIAYLQQRLAGMCREKGFRPVSRDALQRRIDGLGKLEVGRRRLGSKKAKALFAPAPGHCTATRPMEMVQIDHTPVDVILVSEDDRREVMDRPWLTVAIDVFTRMVVGFHVTFDAPSALSVALCLTHVILPKESYLVGQGVQGEWPCRGTMTILLMDNAREFHSQALERGAEEHGIELRYRPVATPQYGGHIERLVGTMMGYCHLLPGTTGSNVVAKGDYDAEAHACMTLSEFRAWLTLQIVNDYHLKQHATLGVPPLVAWKQANPALPVAPSTKATELELLVAFLPAERRKVQRTGLQLWNLHYWAVALRDFLDQGETCLVHYDPRDIGKVYMRAKDGVLVEASTTEEGFKGLSLTEHRRRRRERKRVSESPDLLRRRDENAKAADALVAKSIDATHRARRKPRARRERPTGRTAAAPPNLNYGRPLVRLVVVEGGAS